MFTGALQTWNAEHGTRNTERSYPLVALPNLWNNCSAVYKKQWVGYQLCNTDQVGGDFGVDNRPPTYTSTDHSVEIFMLLRLNDAVNKDVGVRLLRNFKLFKWSKRHSCFRNSSKRNTKHRSRNQSNSLILSTKSHFQQI